MKENLVRVIEENKFWKNSELDTLMFMANVYDSYTPEEMKMLIKKAIDYNGCTLYGECSEDGKRYTLRYPEVYLPECEIDLASDIDEIKNQLENYIVAIKCSLANQYWALTDNKDLKVMKELMMDAMKATSWFVEKTL